MGSRSDRARAVVTFRANWFRYQRRIDPSPWGCAITVTFDDAAALLSEPAIAEVRAQPGFRRTVEDLTSRAIDHYLSLNEAFQWMLKDLGRVAIGFTAMVMDGTEQGLTAGALIALCKTNDISSPGRVTQFLNRGYQYGEITPEPGPGHWTRRRLILGPGFFQHYSERVRRDMQAMTMLAPDIAAATTLLDEPEIFRHYSVSAGAIVASRPDLFKPSPSRPPYLFGKRDAGMLMLHDLMMSQPTERSRLLEEAPLSRAALSRRFGVSRAHVNAMLSEAGKAGLLSCPQPDRVVFSPILSESIERQNALLIQLTRAAAMFALATRPNR
jgi:hypothetical protein